MSALYEIYLQHRVICTDTRNIIPNSLFFCLKGENFDGNKFALDALDKGAAYVVTENHELASNPHCVVVEDSLVALQQLAHEHRQHLTIPVIGITGTNGKTTTKELTAAVLKKKFRVAYTQGNLNNHIGVPLTLLSIGEDAEIAIVEMGANHPGEIDFLARIANPKFGLITNIGTAHIEGFGSRENIIQTKKALYDEVMRNEGHLFVNAQDELLSQLVEGYAHLSFYGVEAPAEVQGNVVDMTPYLNISLFGKTVPTHLTGMYNLNNMLAAAAVGRFFGVAENDIAAAISEYEPSNNRSQVIRRGEMTMIADFYNANPSSMFAALHNLAMIDQGDKKAILGDMLELGSVSETEHENVIAICEELGIDGYFVGAEFAKQNPPKDRSFANVNELNEYLAKNPITKGVVLVKGSRGIHLENVKL